MGIVLNLEIALGSMDILTILILPIYEHKTSCHLSVLGQKGIFTFSMCFVTLVPTL